MRDLFGEDVLDLRYYHFRRLDLDGIPLILTRTGWTSEIGYEIYLLDASRGTDLWERIMEAGAPYEIRPTGPVDIRRIEGGIFNWGADMTYENNPFELGLDRLVDLDSDADFVAREALARIRDEGVKQKIVGAPDRRRPAGDERDDVAGLGKRRDWTGDLRRPLAAPGEEHRLRVAAGRAHATRDASHGGDARRRQGRHDRAASVRRPREADPEVVVSVGTAFHPRTAPLNRKLQWREWSGYLAASAYHDSHEIEYNAIREAAALIDVSPLYKYLVSGPDSTRLVDRVITRDAAKLAVGRVYYTSWCNEQGRVVDDGTVACLDERTYRWTAADPSLRWLRMNASGLDVEIEDVSERISAVAIQGPLSRDVLEAATETSWGDLAYFGRRASRVGRIPVDVSRTGYTGDLGYEVWVESSDAVELWDALVEAGRAYGIRPAGMLALDVARIEAGLILVEVDFDSVRRALIPEQSFSPFELGVLGRFVDFGKQAEFVGRRALEREQARGGPPRRLVGLELEWDPLEGLYREKGLMPTLDPAASREPLPLYARGRQVGKATSTTWSPILKKVVALASVRADHSSLGTRIDFEWTVEGRRHRTPARVVELPFFDPIRKTSTVDPSPAA